MITTSNFQSIRLLRNWCMLTLPTVFNDALSYNEQVCKLTEALNQQGEIIKGLPEYIEQIVKELLEQAGLEDIVKQVLADYFFINVKNPPAPLAPAIGDGVADDTVAIQAMINYVAGKPNYLFFPAGTYSVQGLTMVDGVSLIGLDRFRTILMLRAASNKDLLTGDLGNCTIANIMLNANMPGQTANCSVYSGNVNDMLIGNVIFKNGYNMLSLDVDGTVQIDNVVFDGVQGNGLSLGGTKTMINNIEFVRNSALNAGTLLTISGNNNMVTSLLNTEFATNGVVLNGSDNIVEGWVSGTTTPLTDTGAGNKVSLYTGVDKIVKTGNLIESETGNRTIDVGGQVKETITGSETKNIGGSYTEVVIGSHAVTTGEDYTINGHNISLTASETSNLNGNNISLTASQKTTINGLDVVLNPTNPLTYKTPTSLDENFKSVKMKDIDGIEYDVLVYNGKLNLEGDFANIVDYGAIPEQDCTTAIRDAFASNKGTVYIPPGNWLLNGTVTITNKNVICDGNISYTGSDKFAFIVTSNNLYWKGGVVACRSTNVTADVYGFLLALNYNPTTKTCDWGISYTMEGISMWAWEYAVVGMQNFNCRFSSCRWNTGGAFYGLNFMNGTHDDNIYNGHTTFANCYFVESKRFAGDTKQRALVTLASPKEYYFDNVSFETCPYAINIFRSDSVLLNNQFNLCHFEGITQNAFVSIPINDPYNQPYDRAYAVSVNWTNTFCRSMPGKMNALNPYWSNTIEDVPWIENGGTSTNYYKDLVNANTSAYPVMGKRASWGGHSFPIERVFPDLSAINTLRTNCKTILLNTTTKTLRYSTFKLFGFDGSTSGGLHRVTIYAYAYNKTNSLYGIYEGCVFDTGKGFVTTIKEIKTDASITDFTITGNGGNDQLDVNFNLGNTYTNATIFITGDVIGINPS